MATTYHPKPSSAPLAVFLFSLLIIPLQNHECKPDDDPLNPDEKQALINFMQVPHSENFNWDLSQHACTWKGVTCSPPKNRTVIYLQLPGKSFVGKIPPNTIGRLTGLRGLSLHVNAFKGELPPDFSNLTYLTRLSLNNNSFSGNIPSYFSNFTSLTLNNNSFTGPIPYIHSEKLLHFDVSLNKLIGSIPPSLSKFPRENFTQNVFLCGLPTNITCNESFPYLDDPLKQEKNEKNTSKTLGIVIGSGVVLLMLLCCIRRKICTQTPKPRLEGEAKVENNKLVLFDNHGFSRFGVEDLLKASAEVLGEGSVGRSYKQVLEGKNVTVVVKRLKRVMVTENEFKTRIEVLGKMKNENVVPLKGYYYSQEEKWLVYGYMEGDSLYDRLHGR